MAEERSFIPAIFPGPGSQPAEQDGSQLDYMAMPEEMRAFSTAHIPEADAAKATPAGLAAVEAILVALRRAEAGETPAPVDLAPLDAANLAFVDQLLGEGEVAAVAGDWGQAQESVLAGVWRVRHLDTDGRRQADYAEVGAFPAALLAGAFTNAKAAAILPETVREHVFNAPPLIAEINAAIAAPETQPHVINLSLLPHTDDDLAFLEEALGKGEVIVLSRGYGNCRIHATGTRGCWWVRYYNSQDALILNTIEISPIPAVALAAAEDIADSAERLAEILDIYW